MAKQTFTTGQVLTAAQVNALQLNDYNQTVSAKVASYTLVAADAGTRITMSNASATTITVNTSLFAAGDTLFITNIGAGASTITAGTATVSTASSLVLAQYDSGALYFTSTGVAIWQKYDSAGGAASPAFALVKAKTTFTSVATTTTTFDGVFTSSYRNYLIVFDNCFAGTSSDDFLMQFRYAGPTTQATGYYGINIEATVGNVAVTNSAPNNSSSMQLSDDAGSSSNTGSGYAWVIEAGNLSTKSRIYGSYLESVTAGGGFFANGATDARIYTGFILSSSSSNITGSVTVYGLVTA